MEFVDLDLPSGTKWAKCNLGAKTETDYGDYFMWGSIIQNTKTEWNWSNSPFNNGSISCDEEYFNTHKSEWLDDNDNLKFEYDAAYQSTNGIAHIPTAKQFKEILDNTTNEWTQVNGVNGMKFISKIDESKYIFIPAAGICGDGSVYYMGYYGIVWSSSLRTSYPRHAWGLYFSSVKCGVSNYSHYYGRSIRPVTD